MQPGPTDRKALDWAKDHIQKLDSYTEVSPSGKGFKTFLHAKVAKDHHGDKVGVFSKTRYFCVTGPKSGSIIQEH